MPLAVFPKCFLDALCVHRTMTLAEWIHLASTLPVEGLEFYSGFLPQTPIEAEEIVDLLEEKNLQMPMLCCSPDFTNPDPEERAFWIEQEKKWIDITAYFGGKICRVLSGQRRPEVSREQGIQWVVECIETLLPYAEQRGVILAMENHYKDNYWQYPEFAQKQEIFLEIVNRIQSPWFGVNYDPSNALIAGEDPIALLEAVAHRVVSMHASDRYLEGGTLEDLRQMELNPQTGYAHILKHGVVGQGLNDYDKIFSILKKVGFKGWISIEDGQNPETGMEDLRASAEFLRQKMAQYGLS